MPARAGSTRQPRRRPPPQPPGRLAREPRARGERLQGHDRYCPSSAGTGCERLSDDRGFRRHPLRPRKQRHAHGRVESGERWRPVARRCNRSCGRSTVPRLEPSGLASLVDDLHGGRRRSGVQVRVRRRCRRHPRVRAGPMSSDRTATTQWSPRPGETVVRGGSRSSRGDDGHRRHPHPQPGEHQDDACESRNRSRAVALTDRWPCTEAEQAVRLRWTSVLASRTPSRPAWAPPLTGVVRPVGRGDCAHSRGSHVHRVRGWAIDKPTRDLSAPTRGRERASTCSSTPVHATGLDLATCLTRGLGSPDASRFVIVATTHAADAGRASRHEATTKSTRPRPSAIDGRTSLDDAGIVGTFDPHVGPRTHAGACAVHDGILAERWRIA